MAFGLLLGLIGCAVAGIEGIQRDVEDTQERNKAMRNGNLTYYDSYGHEHLTSNGRRVITTTMNGSKDVVIRDLKSDKVYYNLSEIRRANEPKKKMKLHRRGSARLPHGFEATFWDREDYPSYCGIPDGVKFVEIFTPWNNKEMDDIFKEKEPNKYEKKNDKMRREYNEKFYWFCYGDEYKKYRIETHNWDMKFEDYIKINNYPTLEEFINKYNL